MNLVKSSDIAYEGTSVIASYEYKDEGKMQFGIHDFQLFAAVSVVDGNQALIEVSAVNRGLPAKNIYLRVYPIIGEGIAELPLAEIMADSLATYQELTLESTYLLPLGEEVDFIAIIDDGDDIREVFELNNSLRFDAGGTVSGLFDPKNETCNFTVFPNPFTRELNIAYQLHEQVKNIIIKITNLDGKIVDQVTKVPIQKGKHVVSWHVSELQKGIFIVSIEGTSIDGKLFSKQVTAISIPE
jgi:hypothetical protein